MKKWTTLHFLVLISVFLQQASSEVGIVYSPYFMEYDDGPRSTFYTTEDVKVKLQLVSEQGYHVIATYGVAASAEPYSLTSNSSWRASSSVVHAAIAAAKINRQRNHPILSVYQGFRLSTNDLMLYSEIEDGFDIVAMGNTIFSKTVTSITFPSLAGSHSLFLKRTRQAIELVRTKARKLKLKFGIRLWDCAEIIPKREKNDTNILDLLGSIDYIICKMTPTHLDFPRGQHHFATQVIKEIITVDKAIKDVGLEIEVILETGWPGDESLDGENSVAKMIQFRNQIENWSKETNQKVFIYEAFNSPWKNQDEDLATHYGIFKHLQTNEQPEPTYVLKVAESLNEKTILINITQSDHGIRDISWKPAFGGIFGIVLLILVITIVMIRLMCCFYKRKNSGIHHTLL